MQNAPKGHYAILLIFIKLPFVVKIFALSIFEWPFYTDFTVSPLRNHVIFVKKKVHALPPTCGGLGCCSIKDGHSFVVYSLFVLFFAPNVRACVRACVCVCERVLW